MTVHTHTSNGTLTPEQHEAATFLSGHWRETLRHKAAAALAGGLLRQGLGVETVEHFIGAVAEQAGDEEVENRVAVVKPTAKKLTDRDNRVTGFPTLERLLGKDGENVVRELKVRLGLIVTLEKLAAYKALTVEYLQSLGLHDHAEGGVGIPYRDGAGPTVAVKRRTALVAKEGSYWPKGVPPIIYGEDRLDDRKAAGYRVLVEGESDCWALWFHQFPALGIPGADAVKKTLALGHVAGVKRLYVHQEPGAGGTAFVQNVVNRLAELRWSGELLVVRLDGIKDPSDLHKHHPDQFRDLFQQALDRATPAPPLSTTAEPWQPPVPLPTAPEPAPFPLDVFPQKVQDFLREAAAAFPCPVDYLAVPLLVMAGGALGARRALAVKSGHVQRAIIFAAVIGPPGSAKTPALELVVEPAHETAERYQAEWDEAMQVYEADLEQYEADLKEFRKKKEGDPPKKPQRPVLARVTVNDATAEALVPILKENPCGVVLVRDEFIGWVQAMNQYREGGKGADQQFWLSAWSGATVEVDRKKTHDFGPLRVRHPFISVIGGLTPDKLSTLRGDRPKQRAEQDGFMDRLLLSYPLEPRVEAENWREIADATKAELREVLDALRALAMVPVEVGGVVKGWRPFVVRLTASGKQAWQRFTEAHAAERNSEDFEDHLIGPWSKLRGYCVRLALVLHYLRWACGEVEGDTADVDSESVERAARLVAYFKSHARRVYAKMDADPRVADARHVLKWLGEHPDLAVFTRRDVHQGLRRHTRFSNPENLDSPLKLLEQHGYIRAVATQAARGPGRPPAEKYEKNPMGMHPQYPQNPRNDRQEGGDVQGDGSPGLDFEDIEDIEDIPQEAKSCVEAAGPGGPEPSRNGEVGHRPEGAPKDDASAAYLVVRDPADLPMVLTALEQTRFVGLDTETTGLDPRTDRVRLLSLDCDTTDGGRFTYLVDCFAVDPTPLFEALAGKEIIAHNGAFDLAFLTRLGFVPGIVHDTMLHSQLLYGTRKARGFHGLAECVRRELGREMDKTGQKSNWSGTLTPEQFRYAAEDAALLLPLYTAQAEKLKDAGLEKVAEVEGRCLPALAWAGQRGVAFDKGAWQTLVDEAEGEAKALGDRLDALAPQTTRADLFGTNWNSPEQVKAVFQAIGVELDSTDDEHLAAVKHPVAGLLRQYRAAQKRSSTYGRDWLGHVAPDGRVYAGWRQVGADSGRMACRAPNLQNLPRDPRYRRCFVAPPGRVLVKADYSQVELRIAAEIAGEERMVEAYRRGDDLHILTARTILGKQEVTKADRQLAKAVNFGLLYGMGWKGFRVYARTQYGVELTEQQAQDYRAAFFKAYPGLARWHRSIPKPAIETRTLVGRRRLNVERFTEKLNTPVQGTGADGLKIALALLWERRAEAPGAFPVLAVHDEIVVEGDCDQAEAVAVWLRKAMIDGMQPLIDPVPVEVEVTVGATWGG